MSDCHKRGVAHCWHRTQRLAYRDGPQHGPHVYERISTESPPVVLVDVSRCCWCGTEREQL